jgi:hypothetical protein
MYLATPLDLTDQTDISGFALHARRLCVFGDARLRVEREEHCVRARTAAGANYAMLAVRLLEKRRTRR